LTSRQIQIPEDLCAAIEAKFGHKFASVQELLTFLLRELLRDAATQADQAEERLIEQRLRELGYL